MGTFSGSDVVATVKDCAKGGCCAMLLAILLYTEVL